MIRLPKFAFCAPTSPTEACEILAQGNGDTKILAGGTDLIVGMKQGVSTMKRLVWLGRLKELQQIVFSPEHGLHIGAMCTLDEIGRNKHVQQYYPSLIQALGSIASPQIRHRATIGGNLCLNTRCFYYDQSEYWRRSLGFCLKFGDGICHAAPELDRCSAVFSSDLAPLLIALDASVTLCDERSSRTIPLSQLYRGDGVNHLTIGSSELLTLVSIPCDLRVRATFAKLRRRNAIDYPLVNVGIALVGSEESVPQQVRIVVGAITNAPIDFSDAARRLCEGEITNEQIEETAETVAAGTHPIPNVDGLVSYRKKMVEVLVRKSLERLIAHS